MCTIGNRSAADLKKIAIRAINNYRANSDSMHLRMTMVLAILEYDATPTGIRNLEKRVADASLSAEARSMAERRLLAGQKLLSQKKRAWKRSQWLHLDDIAPVWKGDEKTRPDLRNPMVGKAFVVAVNAHAGVYRKNGEPYINHPLRTAKRIQDANFEPEAVAIALLHDSVEDSALDLSDLRAMGFSPRIVSGVDSVTKRTGEAYPETVNRACQHPDGSLVKLSDNLDNSSREQLMCFPEEKRQKQLKKYAPAMLTLVEQITGGVHLEPQDIFTKSYRMSMAS